MADCANAALASVTLGTMSMFRKTNDTPHSDALLCEAEGLEALRQALSQAGESRLKVPRVYDADEQSMTLDAIASRPGNDAQMRAFGDGLAALHSVTAESSGWRNDNYIGLSPQPNRWSNDWGTFFTVDRLGFQVGLIRDGRVRQRFESVLKEQHARLVDWLNERCERPSLLHGDLWQGNVLFDGDSPWLIDPAVYQGDREADLAMTEMFGGFSPAFYDAYDRAIGITRDYRTKKAIYNLYHYLNHYNLFGGGYLGGCERGFEVIRAL
ncbi:fructosamine kinase family protein [Tamilnaduibacter salinus]|nr:fructosamine kinase family protein [Tamilnaduibacter salinus]